MPSKVSLRVFFGQEANELTGHQGQPLSVPAITQLETPLLCMKVIFKGCTTCVTGCSLPLSGYAVCIQKVLGHHSLFPRCLKLQSCSKNGDI